MRRIHEALFSPARPRSRWPAGSPAPDAGAHTGAHGRCGQRRCHADARRDPERIDATGRIDITLDKATSGSAVSSGVIGGSYQIGKSSVAGLITAHAKGVPFVFVARAGCTKRARRSRR